MGNMGKLIVAVEHDLRAQIARCDMTCTLQNRIHGVLDAAQEQNKCDDGENDDNDKRNERRRLDTGENILAVRHLRTRETHAVRLVLLEDIGHALVDIRLFCECERDCAFMIACIQESRCTLTHVCIRLALFFQLIEACQLL